MPPVVPLPGEIVWIRQRRWRVERARRDRNVVRIDVASRDDRLTFLSPFDRPAIVGRSPALRRVRRQHALARLAGVLSRAHGWRSLAIVADAAVAVLPHQLEPALAMLSGARRVLVADEVGLGKTIQAGIVIAETLARHPASRVIVIVPGSLRAQWARELADRFRIDAIAADRRGLDELSRHGAFGDNPWRRHGVWIASLDFLKQRHVLEALPVQPWDLVVIDEAHAACGDSDRHEACDDIARRGRGVLLLTATPHSGDAARFERLLDIGRLGGAGDAMKIFRRTRAGLDLPSTRSVRWHRVTPTDRETRTLEVLSSYEAAVLRAPRTGGQADPLLLLSVFRKRALSTMTALGATLARRLAWLGGPIDTKAAPWLQPRLAFDDLIDDIDDDERQVLMADVGLDPRQERSWLRRLLTLAEAATSRESKVERVVRLIERAREPAIVFTEFRDSSQVLSARLARLVPTATLHGGLTEAERAQQLARFLHGGARVLVATDVAGQGLNLQSRARWVISLELPWNPVRLEQRIGRVDRIGQTRRVHFTLLVARDHAEAGVLRNLSRRVLAARNALGDDVLEVAAPTESACRDAVFTPHAADRLDRGATVRLDLCRHWQRPAGIAAKRLTVIRALRSRWRGDALGSAPVWMPSDRFAAVGCRSGAAFVFSVCLTNRGGDVVERHVVAVRAAEVPRSRLDLEGIVEAARRVAAARLLPRAARVTRTLRARLQHESARELSVAGWLAEAAGPVEAQPGLFDRSAHHEFDAIDEERRTLEHEARLQLDRHSADAIVDVSRPILEIAWLPRR